MVVNADGTFTYTPNADFNGSDFFTFRANDGTADSGSASFTFIVNPVNDPPVAQDGSASGTEDTPVTGTLVATDVDSEGLTYRLGTQAAHGTVVVNPDGTFTYTPNADFFGTDSFTSLLANDGAVDSNAATISLSLAAVNDAPQLDLDADNSTAASTYFVDDVYRRQRASLGHRRRYRGSRTAPRSPPRSSISSPRAPAMVSR